MSGRTNFITMALLAISCLIMAETKGYSATTMEKIKSEADYCNSLGMTFRKIPGKDFLVQSTEVTQAQWLSVMESNPAYFKGDNMPASKISWDDAQAFVEKLNAKGLGTYRLPREAEWEYACRANTTTEFYWGDAIDGDYCWYFKNSNNKINPVGQKKPNAWGLYDMSGNVWEFCADKNGNMRVVRGGSYSSKPKNCRSAGRGVSSRGRKANGFGFRLIREAD